MKRILLFAFSFFALVTFSKGQVLTIGSLNAGANNVAVSPLPASSAGKAIFGFSLTSSGAQVVGTINVQLSSTPTGKFGNWSLIKSTDTDFATGGDNTTVGGTFTPSATQVAITGLSEGTTTTQSNYFLVADVNAAVTGATPAVQASISGTNVTVGAGTVGGSAGGTSYSFQALTLTIGSLNAGANNVALSPLGAGATGRAVFGFSLSSTISQTVSAINVQLTSTPTGKLANWSLVRSTDTNFASGGDNTTVGSLTFTPSATQVAITGLSEVITAGSNYFLVADVDPAVTGATGAIQASVASGNITVSGGTITGSSTGTNYSFAGLVLTIGSLNAGANNVALSPLGAGTTGRAVFGFSLVSTVTQTVTVINVQLSSDPSGKLGTWSLVRSTDTDFASGGDNTTVGGLTFTPTATQVGITGLSEVITTGRNYFLVADVNAGVTSATPNIQASLAAANITAGTGTVSGSATGTNYSFSNSTSSTVTLNGGATALIDYGSFQSAAGLTSVNSETLAQFQINDGGGTDADNKSTTLTDVTITIANFANVRTIAIFDGTTNIGEQAVSGGTATFTGLSLVAADDGTKNFRIRATFKAVVTDNQAITIAISSVTALSTGSGFAAANGGGATTGGGPNHINVVADRLAFGAAPGTVNPGINFSLSVNAVDALSNTDVDRTNTVTLSLTAGGGTFSSTDAGGLTPNLVAGARSWSQLKIVSPGAPGAKTVTAAYTGLTSATINFSVISLGANVTPANPLSVCFNGDFQPLTSITVAESDQSDFGTGSGQIFYLEAPTGFIFDTSVTTTPAVSGSDISSPSALSYVGNTLVRFSYNISGSAGIDNFIISGLKIKYTGTTGTTGNIKVVNASAQIAGDDEAAAKNHGTVTAAASATVVDFSVFAIPGDPTVPPNQTAFNISNKAVKLVGSPSGGTFTGAAVIYSGTNGYIFDPATVGVGTYPITYTYIEPAIPHCQIIVTKSFTVSTSFINGLLTSYCTTSAPTPISVTQATVDLHHPPAGFYRFHEFVYWEPTTGAFTTMPAPNSTFDPSDPVYANSVNGYSTIWMGYRVKTAIGGVVLPDGPNSYANIAFTSFRITNAPVLAFNLPTDVCVNGTPIDLDALVTPLPGNTVTDIFTGTAVTTPSANQWLFTPSTVPGAGSSPQAVNITYHYKDPAGSCNSTLSKSITVYPLPTVVPAANINSGNGSDIAICQGSSPPQFTAAAIVGTTYNWYTNGGVLLATNRNTFSPQTPFDFDNNVLGTTVFKLTRTINGCEGPATNVSVTVNQPVTVDAGTTVQICAGAPLTLSSLGASISGPVTTGTWSSASPVGSQGTFSPNATFTGAITYTPHASEVAAQAVKLVLTSTDPTGPCDAVVKTVTIIINSATTVIAGNPTSFCAGQGQLIALNGNITGGITTGTWSRSGGSGTFSDTGTATSPSLSTIYVPTLAETNSPIPINITFTLTSDDPAGPCSPIVNSVIYTLEPAPVVFAGSDLVLCADQPVNLSGTFSGGATSVTWTHNGLGGFSNPTAATSPATTTYNPDPPTEIANGASVMITLTTNDPAGPCKAADHTLNLTINPVPVAPTVNTPAATPGKIYYCVNDVIADLSAGGNNIKWYNNPGLTGSPATGNTFTPPISSATASTTTFYVTQTNLGCESKLPLSIGAPTQVQVIIDPLPVPNFTASLLCFPDSTLFDASSSTVAGGFSIVKYGWDFADQTTISPGLAGSTIATSSTNGTFEKPSHFFETGSYDVILTAVSNSTMACSKSIQASLRPAPNNSQIKIGPYPIPNFTVGDLCFGDTTRFIGEDNSANVTATDTWLWNFGEAASLDNTSTIKNPSHHYATAVTNSVNFQVTSVLGCARSITKPVSVLPYIKTFPLDGYHEHFDTGSGGWVTEGLNTNQFTSWQLDAPNERIIKSANSGANAWITNAYVGPSGFNTYHDNERSVLNGPCFDMTALLRPVLSFSYWDNTSLGSDGTYIQTSIDGGQNWEKLGAPGEGLGWYDRSSISGLSQVSGLGGELIGQPTGQDGWSGTTSQWKQSKFNMDEFKTIKKLRIRYVFGSNLDNPALDTLDGFAMDDFAMENRNRTLLAENFINATADASNTSRDAFYAFQSTTTTNELVKIEYHTGMGGPDPFYELSRADADARAGFYGVTSSPRGFLSGKSGGAITSGGWSQASYDVESLVTSPLDISIFTPAGPDDSLFHVQATINTNEDLPPGQYVIQIAAVEKHVGSNQFVLRKLIPDAAGTPLTALTKNSSQTIQPYYTWNMANLTSGTELSVVVFVQSLSDDNEKTVVQAQYLGSPTLPDVLTGMDDVILPESIGIFPNPSNKQFEVQLPWLAKRQVGLKLWDQMGKLVQESFIPTGEWSKTVPTDELANGVYILHVETGNGVTTRKKVLVTHAP